MNLSENKKLYIGCPYIEDVDKTHSRLCAKISCLNSEKIMYFEVENQYKEYLCTELSDAFITGIFYFASYNSFDIVCEAPASERLLYQMNQYYIPTVNKMDSRHYKRIKIVAKPSNIFFEKNYAVGTAVSSGVDSFYSILSHYKRKDYPKFELTHLMVANLFNKYVDEDETREKFDKLTGCQRIVAEELGLPIVTMYTNHHHFLFPDYVEFYSLRICSYIFALQKLFKIYLISSGTMFQDSNFWSDDSTDYDVFNTTMSSTDNVNFYMSGGESGRVQKIEYIREYPIVRNHLHVCTLNDEKNCSVCDKCMRTMVSIELTGNLNEYSGIFDLSLYNKNKVKYWGKVISQAKDNVYGVLNIELIKEAKLRGYTIPKISYIMAWFIWRPYIALKKFLKKFKLIKKIYFALKIDYLVYGKEKAELYRFSKD